MVSLNSTKYLRNKHLGSAVTSRKQKHKERPHPTLGCQHYPLFSEVDGKQNKKWPARIPPEQVWNSSSAKYQRVISSGVLKNRPIVTTIISIWYDPARGSCATGLAPRSEMLLGPRGSRGRFNHWSHSFKEFVKPYSHCLSFPPPFPLPLHLPSSLFRILNMRWMVCSTIHSCAF